MIHLIRAKVRHLSDLGWLKTYWLFSFADYYDPDNIQFGALRVFNDDVVQPGAGFPTHPHREMEIVTIPLDGEITHADSMRNETVIKAGDVQRMSAGTGLTHSEFNLGDEPVHFYQIWILPDAQGLSPTYDQRTYSPNQWSNRLFPVASGRDIPDTVTFNTDATIYRSTLDSGRNLAFRTHDSRHTFIYLGHGDLVVNDERLRSNDQARIDEVSDINLKAMADSDFALIDVPSCKGWGYGRETLKGAQTR